jgi:hypothetical protein
MSGMDRKLRAMVLASSEVIERQKHVIDSTKCVLKLKYEGDNGLQIYVEQGKNSVYSTCYNEDMLEPMRTEHEFAKHALFLNLTKNMNLAKQTYGLALLPSEHARIYFLYDGSCHIAGWDDDGITVTTVMDSTSFQVLLEAYEKGHIGLGPLKYTDYVYEYYF